MTIHPPPLKILFWPIDRLIPSARNARQHSEAQVAQIAASIREFGFNNPVLVGESDDIIAGHGRVLGARKAGFTEVPVVVLSHLSPNQKRAFALADNQLALGATWDVEMLRLELEALAEENVDLTPLGFSDEQLQELLAQPGPVGQCEPDEIPDIGVQIVSHPGDLWVLGEHRLLCGDGTNQQDVGRVLESGMCDMVFADLPYNVNYTGKGPQKLQLANDNMGDNFGEFLESACRALLGVSRGGIYICMSSSELHRLYPAFCKEGGHWSTYIVWAKNVFTLGRSDYQRQYEPILYGWREGAHRHWCGDRNQGDVWEIDKPFRNDLHPTMKPVALVERAIRNSSRRGDTVLDAFGGAGSTLIACANLGRRARIIEIDPRYADVIVRRWQQYTGQTAYLEANGGSFADAAEQRRAGLPGKEAVPNG